MIMMIMTTKILTIIVMVIVIIVGNFLVTISMVDKLIRMNLKIIRPISLDVRMMKL